MIRFGCTFDGSLKLTIAGLVHKADVIGSVRESSIKSCSKLSIPNLRFVGIDGSEEVAVVLSISWPEDAWSGESEVDICSDGSLEENLSLAYSESSIMSSSSMSDVSSSAQASSSSSPDRGPLIKT